ncbi:hypothetical protein H6G89_02355 [Oscillatoria sp. FACHB-1407]|uniref:hypothetical protein n=1 Tax=Oscillatoria sp. FACHB-1407 TaxID=2692847 RepID=UPI001684275C|nr:hypothetical protein [Oscillatoria sp. FACHB-1407]MBD2459876.1 hypothetical protein [Oscillatoria sp. FACHB-1407]
MYTHFLYQPQTPAFAPQPPKHGGDLPPTAQSPPELGDLGGEEAPNAKQTTCVYTVPLSTGDYRGLLI